VRILVDEKLDKTANLFDSVLKNNIKSLLKIFIELKKN